mgnify:CR=1 FL=1
MDTIVNAAAIVVGFGLIVWMLLDSFETLLATSLRANRYSFTAWYYRGIWWAYRRWCVRIADDDRRERWLARFGPASFLGLLATWTFIEIFGWGLVWWGFRSNFGDAISSLGKIVSDNAGVIDEKLGTRYGDYARTAARSMQETAAKIEAKDLAELGEDAKEFVRKKPGVAIGIAAVVGFFVARLFRGGSSDEA